MKEKLWLKLSGILLAGILFLSFSLSWIFSVSQSRRLNFQTQLYLSEYLSSLYTHINLYLKKKTEPSFVQLQKIFSLYSVDAFGKSDMAEKENISHSLFAENGAKKSFFLINDSGFVLAHSEPNYKGGDLPKSSPFLSLVRQYSQGWNLIVENGASPSLITVSRSIAISSVKYFLIASQPAQKSGSLFLSYFKWILLFSVLSFLFLFLVIFFTFKIFYLCSSVFILSFWKKL